MSSYQIFASLLSELVPPSISINVPRMIFLISVLLRFPRWRHPLLPTWQFSKFVILNPASALSTEETPPERGTGNPYQRFCSPLNGIFNTKTEVDQVFYPVRCGNGSAPHNCDVVSILVKQIQPRNNFSWLLV